MWAYYNSEAMAVNELYIFKTKTEALKFAQMGTQRNMEEYPDEPEMWPMIENEWGGQIFKLSSPMTAEQAFAEWFGDDL